MVVEELGRRFEVMRTDIKKWSVGAPIQAPLDALDTLIKRERFDASQVKQVVVRVATDEAAIVNNREISDINLQHLIAVMLLDKTVSFKAAHDVARMKDPAVLRERAKVQLVPDDELEKLMPQRTAIVEVTLTDGRTSRERVGTVRGTAANPMTKDEGDREGARFDRPGAWRSDVPEALGYGICAGEREECERAATAYCRKRSGKG
jgi:2-methylcitrate dehydratase PrpD